MTAKNTILKQLNALNFKHVIAAVEPMAEDISTCLTKERVDGLKNIIFLENISESRKFIISTICENWDEIPWKYKLKFASILYFMAFVSNSAFTFVSLMGFVIGLKYHYPEFDEKFIMS